MISQMIARLNDAAAWYKGQTVGGQLARFLARSAKKEQAIASLSLYVEC